MRRFRKLAVATLSSGVILITIGAVVRATGSGLGCPDWPKCHGSWIPPMERTALIEYSHRLSASIVGLLVFSLATYAWVRFRRQRFIFWPSFWAFIVVVFQGALGRLVVERDLASHLVALHFGTALALLGLLTLVTTNAYMPRGGATSRTSRDAFAMAASVAVVLMLGAFVTQTRAALVFGDWPLMDGGLVPWSPSSPQVVHFLHRLVALLLGGVIGYVAYRMTKLRPKDRLLLGLAHTSFALWIVQIAAGAANVLTRSADWAIVVHVAFGALLWVAAVALATLSYRKDPEKVIDVAIQLEAGLPEAEPARAGGALATIRSYVMLTKPRIIELLLITTVPSMMLAWHIRGERPSILLILATLIGGTLTAGAANAINCYYDRDIDQVMQRTSVRPLPRGEVSPPKALTFGICLGIAGAGWLVATVNVTAAALAVGAIFFYVFIYTLWLKRTSPANIVIGGAAGAFPPLVGWAAVTGTLQLPAWILFAVIFYWTPPHFWALSLRYREDYSRAGVPMLPVVGGIAFTTRHIVLYSVALTGVSLLMMPAARMGWTYLATAAVLGAIFVARSLKLRKAPDDRAAMSLFHVSITYLTLLFAAVAADGFLPVGNPGSVGDDVYMLVMLVGFVLLGAAQLLIGIFAVRHRLKVDGLAGPSLSNQT